MDKKGITAGAIIWIIVGVIILFYLVSNNIYVDYDKHKIGDSYICLNNEIIPNYDNFWDEINKYFEEKFFMDLDYDGELKQVILTFEDTTGLAEYFKLEVRKTKDRELICNNTSYESIGVLVCDVSDYIGTFRYESYLKLNSEKTKDYLMDNRHLEKDIGGILRSSNGISPESINCNIYCMIESDNWKNYYKKKESIVCEKGEPVCKCGASFWSYYITPLF